MFARGAHNKAACIPVVHVLHVVLCWTYSIVERSREVGGWGVLHVFPIASQISIYRNQAANLHVMVKNCLQTQHYFSREEKTVHFANWLLQESAVVQYPRPPPYSPLVDTRKATKPIPSCERRDVDLWRGGKCDWTRAYSHLGWEPLGDLRPGWHSWLLSVTEENWTWTVASPPLSVRVCICMFMIERKEPR